MYSDCLENFGWMLKDAMERKGITQEYASEHLCVSRTLISKWWCSKSFPTLSVFAAICDMLDVEPGYFFYK